MQETNKTTTTNNNVSLLEECLHNLFNADARGIQYWRKHKYTKCYICHKYGHMADQCKDVCVKCGNIHNGTVCVFSVETLYKKIIKILNKNKFVNQEEIVAKINKNIMKINKDNLESTIKRKYDKLEISKEFRLQVVRTNRKRNKSRASVSSLDKSHSVSISSISVKTKTSGSITLNCGSVKSIKTDNNLFVKREPEVTLSESTMKSYPFVSNRDKIKNKIKKLQNEMRQMDKVKSDLNKFNNNINKIKAIGKEVKKLGKQVDKEKEQLKGIKQNKKKIIANYKKVATKNIVRREKALKHQKNKLYNRWNNFKAKKDEFYEKKDALYNKFRINKYEYKNKLKAQYQKDAAILASLLEPHVDHKPVKNFAGLVNKGREILQSYKSGRYQVEKRWKREGIKTHMTNQEYKIARQEFLDRQLVREMGGNPNNESYEVVEC